MWWKNQIYFQGEFILLTSEKAFTQLLSVHYLLEQNQMFYLKTEWIITMLLVFHVGAMLYWTNVKMIMNIVMWLKSK